MDTIFTDYKYRFIDPNATAAPGPYCKNKVVNFLHIGKTGGTAIIHALNGRLVKTDRYIIKFHHHPVKLRDIPTGEKVVFFLRDPITRFMSGFYSRKRRGKPKYYTPWSNEEELAFKQFQSSNELALALTSENTQKAISAKNAMNSIYHVKSSFWDWFENELYFISRKQDVLFVGFQERLDQDFDKLKSILHLPDNLTLPQDSLLAHKSPAHLSTHLDEEALQNLKEWYEKDYLFIQLCNTIHLIHTD